MSEPIELTEQERAERTVQVNAEANAKAVADYSALAARCGATVEVGKPESLSGIAVGAPVVVACLDALASRLAEVEAALKRQ